ncbi:hypothetical protein M378DRAFT_960307 [Amanita muscaria Koide BX008]|uniref:Nephrocystin 3-like N-terminal domain-containing protein n=1 Tax=Amanita muscaria (strain Koide BX008) TaxID=946122 RepID=A0A0C2SB32_AMAMK|nr:hypothetical protein M378DRAFT_960307 [Amanita muscaria Koide BX008]
MVSSTSGASPQQLLQSFKSLQTNNQDNKGLIGDGSNNIVNSGDGQVNQFNITQAEGEDVELDRLLDRHVSNDGLFYSPPEFHPNTRTTIRDEIGEWLDESVSKKSPFLWLNGPAGLGKSVIAKAVSGFYDQIVATFFFSMSSDKTAATLFPTLAWQLARRIPETRKHIIASLKRSDSLQTSQIEDQFDLLIIQPLKSTTTLKYRPVMVIDGVDECTDEAMLGRFLRVLVKAGEGGDMPVRFIICSRPEPRIHAILRGDRDINPARDVPKPPSPREDPQAFNFVLGVTGALLLVFGLLGSIGGSVGSFRTIQTFGIRQLFQDIREYGIFHLFRLIRRYTMLGAFELTTLFWNYFGFFALLTQLGGLLGVLAFLASDLPRSEARLPTPIQQSQGILQDVRELYRPIPLDVDKDTHSLSTSDRLDTICSYPVISTIRIGFSQECKDDMTRYLTDNFNAKNQPGDDPRPWFLPSDISNLVEASCGQFLYASTIVGLLDDPHFPRTDLLKMARRNSLLTPDLDGLYKAILKRAQEGSPGYQLELGFVKVSLAILVVFAGNVNFLPVRKSFPIIEFLLGLEKG